MANLKFADTYNMVEFLSKPAESKGFEQIVDFLNAHIIKYALTVNPTIYTLCIEQFWATVKAKTINGEVQLQALVNGKKIIITESIVRRDLQLEDADGVDCLPNATIFEQLTLMGMVKNLDNVSGNFLMYPKFVQVFVNQQLEGMPSHKRIYISPSHTKKIFGNMRRVGKGFSERETLLFQTMMVQDQEEIGEGSEMPTDSHHTPTIIQPSTSQPQNKQRSRRSKRKDNEVPQPSGPITNVANKAVNEEMDYSLGRAATIATGLDAEQDRGNIDMTQSKATLNESSSLGTSSGNGTRRQETMGDTIAQTRLKLEELMAFCTTLQSRVLALETIKTAQANEIASLKKRVKKLNRRNKLRTYGLKRLNRGRISDIDANEDIYLVNVRTDEDMFGVNDLDGDELIVKSVDVFKTAEETRSVVEEVTAVTIPVSAATTTTITTAITDVEMTLAQALVELKSVKPMATTITTTPTLITTAAATTVIAVSTRPIAKGLVIHKQEQAPTPTVSSQQPSQVKVQDKGKGKMVKLEPMKKMSKKELLRLDEELVFKLQAKEKEEERLAREKAQQMEEAKIAWDDVQAKINIDY
ncbi:hypothetical protein Tco_0282958 [Tanacetum coccineum]